MLLPLLKQIAAITFWLIPKSKREDESKGELRYLSGRFPPTPQLAFPAAWQEIRHMLQLTEKMTEKFIFATQTNEAQPFKRLLQNIQIDEQTTDILEHKINTYLTQLIHGNLSRHAVTQSVVLLDVLNNIERIADCAEKSARILGKFYPGNRFSAQDKEDFVKIAQLTKQILARTKQSLSPLSAGFNLREENANNSLLFEEALADEHTLNQLRKTLLHNRRERILHQTPDPDTVTAYADILNNFELTGDYALHSLEQIKGLQHPANIF